MNRQRKVGQKRVVRREPRSPVLAAFLPAVREWFEQTFPCPSPAQELAWPRLRLGENVLLLAPTGSGKTLAAFLCAIDELLRRAQAEDLAESVQVLYVTPLKALGNDIQRNLLVPLAGIGEMASEATSGIRVAVRTGDTPPSERQRMIARPPHILITTPESLYLLLGSRQMAPHLRTVRTVIVDEVHSLCDNKRGVHLALSLERLEERVDGPLQRIGCSATLSPLQEIAAFLVGYTPDGQRRPCTVVNAGMRKGLDVQVVAPLPDFLEASHSALWATAYELILGEIARHRTTLVFTNSRYKTERTTLRLRELAAEGQRIAAHHGSMSRETRLEAEDDLKAGRLDALVATATLELGIDIGAVDLVCQLESPRSVATCLQRVGRAGHLLGATSQGRVLAFDRDELLEAAAIARAAIAGQIDDVRMPRGCLDVLAQQVAGAVAAETWDADGLYQLVRRAHPYRDLPREAFDRVVGMLAGERPFQMAWPPRPLLLWDRVTGRLSPTRGSAQVCAMNVGTIPDTAEYEVVLAGGKKRIGAVQSEFVDDSLRTGDIFVLGSSTWRMAGMDRGRLLVEPAPGATPTIPWWHGQVESRTVAAGQRVGELRRELAARLDDPGVRQWLEREYHLNHDGAAALVDYLREQRATAGVVPDHERLLVETWRDELGRDNVIVHSPFGQRVNRTWGIALVAAALQSGLGEWTATASNDILLLTRREEGAREVVEAQALLAVGAGDVEGLVAGTARDAAVYGSAFRAAATCSLQVLRAWQGARVPFWLQGYRAQELQEACGSEPSYPVVAEVIREYLHDSLDLGAVRELLTAVERGQAELVFQEVEAPSPFAHGLLVGDPVRRDQAMGRERRAQLLRLHRQVLKDVLSADEMAELLDPRAIERLEARWQRRAEGSQARTSDELAQVIRELGDLPARLESVDEVAQGDPAALLAPLLAEGRVVAVDTPDCEEEPVRLVTPELWREYRDAFAPGTSRRAKPVLVPRLEDGALVADEQRPARELIPTRWRRAVPQEQARRAVIERMLRCRGPVTAYELMGRTGWSAPAVERALAELVAEGTVAQGAYTRDKPRPQWVNRANLEEIHRLTLGYLRRELAACTGEEVVDFVSRWQHVHPETRLRGTAGLRDVIRQLQGCEVIQGALEEETLAARVWDYSPAMLDQLMAAGEVCWRRVGGGRIHRGMLTLCLTDDMTWLGRGTAAPEDGESSADCDIAGQIRAVREHFREHGAGFFEDVVAATGVEEGAAVRAVWHLAWCGELACDTYECVRHAGFGVTLSACYDLMHTPHDILHPSGGVGGKDTHERVLERMRSRRLDPRLGRWLATERLRAGRQEAEDEAVVRHWAEQLLRRWGIVSREIVGAEAGAPMWDRLLPEFKRRELLGQVSRGDFIESHHGEQYGLPEAVELLRDCRARRGEHGAGAHLPDEPLLVLPFTDPANLYATSLEFRDAAGNAVHRPRRRGSRVVVRAGQPLVYLHRSDALQMAPLGREELRECLERLKWTPGGDEAPTEIARWNGCPVETHPVSGLLEGLGFRFFRGAMRWPPDGTATRLAPSGEPAAFPACYAERRADVGPEYAVGRAHEQVRPVLAAALALLQRELAGEGWEFEWSSATPKARYRGVTAASAGAGASFVGLQVRPPGLTGYRRRWPFRQGWGRVRSVDDLTEDFIAELRRRREFTEAEIEAYLARRGADGEREGPG
ncbi:DEAD/DEAH box helicase [bacterium]|nr:DEAD/DEAH box helicase [bacterium]